MRSFDRSVRFRHIAHNLADVRQVSIMREMRIMRASDRIIGRCNQGCDQFIIGVHASSIAHAAIIVKAIRPLSPTALFALRTDAASSAYAGMPPNPSPPLGLISRPWQDHAMLYLVPLLCPIRWCYDILTLCPIHTSYTLLPLCPICLLYHHLSSYQTHYGSGPYVASAC